MSTTGTTPADTDPLEAVITALRVDGPRTAGQLADHMGIPYSSLSPRLRQLEADGRAERVKDPQTRVLVWHTTAAPAPSDPTDAQAPGVDLIEAGTDHDEPTAADADAAEAEATEPDVGDTDEAPAGPVAAGGPPADTQPAPIAATATTSDKARRGHGEIPAAILALTRANPDATYKVSQLARELGGLSAGAVANAAHKLVARGELLCVNEHPATFQAA